MSPVVPEAFTESTSILRSSMQIGHGSASSSLVRLLSLTLYLYRPGMSIFGMKNLPPHLDWR